MTEVVEIHASGKKCSRCGVRKQPDGFSVRKTGDRKGHLLSVCKKCRASAQKQKKERDKTIYDRIEWPSKLRRIYGLEVEDYYRMLEQQDNGCAICGIKDPGSRCRNFHVDHCHETGKVRGLLCHKCNRALGLFDDNIERLKSAANYLK